jgi:signal transduction histidine kinase
MSSIYSSSSDHIDTNYSPESASNGSKLVTKRFNKWLNNLKVGHKIRLGYVVALGIAVVGTTAGIIIAAHYEDFAEDQELHSRSEIELLNRLQAGVLKSRTHQQQLIPLITQPEQFQEEYNHLLNHIASVNQTWTEVEIFAVRESHVDEVHTVTIPRFIHTYTGVATEYAEKLQKLVQQIHPSKLKSPEETEKAQKLLLNFTNSALALKFDGISDNIVDLLNISYQELQKAEEASQAANVIRLIIVAGSMLFSVAIAALLATYTSRIITRPLEATTIIAQQATFKANFDLQASVTTADEVGVLASSLNQLIQRVKQLLQEQELYNQTLEQKIQHRTLELNQKNEYLEQTLQELKDTQSQLIQSEKMSSLGELVAGVAHEINNPVNFIHGNLSYATEYAENLLRLLQLYQQQYPDPPQQIQAEIEEVDLKFLSEDFTKLLKSMRMGTERIREIVLSLRNFSRLDEAEFKIVDIHEGIESTLMILQNRLKAKPEHSDIEVIKNYGQLPLVECYPGQLNQVFMNLLTNAIDALEESIVKDPGLLTKPQIRIRTEIKDNFLFISIGDNGCGIAEEVQQKLFDPFFTTKPIGKGTGLGLSISYQIITEKHGGKLYCKSAPGEGAEFVIEIPVRQKFFASLKE